MLQITNVLFCELLRNISNTEKQRHHLICNIIQRRWSSL